MIAQRWQLHVLARNLVYWSEHPRTVNRNLEPLRIIYPWWFPEARIYSEVSDIQKPALLKIVSVLLPRLKGLCLWRLNIGAIAHTLQLLLPEEQDLLAQIIEDFYG